ncbi:MAG: dihydrodipicolinate synthase family protein [Clostridia bacterium]
MILKKLFIILFKLKNLELMDYWLLLHIIINVHKIGLIEYYTKIANSVSLPIIIYNVPSRTGVNIEPETCFNLSKIPNIVAIKEASGNISQVAKIASLCRENLYIYSGNDD